MVRTGAGGLYCEGSVDLAKQVFQVYGATAEGEVVFRKKPSRKRFMAFMQAHPWLPGCHGGLRHSASRGLTTSRAGP